MHSQPFRATPSSPPHLHLGTWWVKRFWSADRIKSWYETIFSTDSGTEIVPNLMCLCPNAHRYHERALFALKPIEVSDDKGKLRVQFYWLPRNKLSNSIDILTVPAIPDTPFTKSAYGTLRPMREYDQAMCWILKRKIPRNCRYLL